MPDEDATLSSLHTRKVLWSAVESAKSEYRRSMATCDLLRADLSKIPDAVGDLRIEQAGEIRRIAFEKYLQALQEFAEPIQLPRG